MEDNLLKLTQMFIRFQDLYDQLHEYVVKAAGDMEIGIISEEEFYDLRELRHNFGGTQPDTHGYLSHITNLDAALNNYENLSLRVVHKYVPIGLSNLLNTYKKVREEMEKCKQ